MKTIITRADTRFDYCKSNVLKELTERLEQRKVEVEWLKLIKRAKKKDWTDFQSFLKNYSYPDNLSMNYDGYGCIKIRYKGESVSIAYDTVDEKFIQSVDPERVVHNYGLRDKVYYTPSEFYDRIQENIKWREEDIEDTSDTLQHFEELSDLLWLKLNPVLEYISNIWDNASR